MRVLDKKTAKAFYKINVKVNTYNLRHIDFNDLKMAKLVKNKKKAGKLVDFRYYDPDFAVYENINGYSIRVAQDGICSINKIIQLSNSVKEVLYYYKLIRCNTYNIWKFPQHKNSINVARARHFDDRIDLTLIELEEVYKIIGNADKEENLKELSRRIISSSDIKMKEVYEYKETLIWLLNFKTFDNFVKRNHLEVFVDYEKGHYVAKNWQPETNRFDRKYFYELMRRIRKLKKLKEP